MSKIPFSPDNLIQIITASLSHEAEAQPQLKNSTDAIAIFTNACLLSVGFRLLGLSEDDRLGEFPHHHIYFELTDLGARNTCR